MSVKIVLWVSGFLTLIAVGIPESTTIGLWLLVVPGLILAVAPSVFLYTATFAIVRRWLPINRWPPTTRPFALNLIAAFITLGLGALVALPMALAGRLAFHRAATGDVVPHNRVGIAGNVLLKNNYTPTERIAGKTIVPYDALCAALLDTPGVSTVTIAGTGRRDEPVPPTTYRLVSKGEGGSNAMAPASPEKILQYLPNKPVSSGRRDFRAEMAARKAQENAIIAHWGLRLASEVTLVMVPSPQYHDLTITITSPIKQASHNVTVKEVEVRDREGRVLLRRQHVTAEAVLVPPLVLPYNMPMANWGPPLSPLQTIDRFGDVDINPITVLFDETTLARPSEPADAATGMRDRLAAALTQPGAPSDLSLASPWLATINWH